MPAALTIAGNLDCIACTTTIVAVIGVRGVMVSYVADTENILGHYAATVACPGVRNIDVNVIGRDGRWRRGHDGRHEEGSKMMVFSELHFVSVVGMKYGRAAANVRMGTELSGSTRQGEIGYY